MPHEDLRAEIISLLAVGYTARDAAHPDWCQAQAERLLQRYERALRELREPGSICRVCGGRGQ